MRECDMKPTMWVLAGSASILAGCGDREYTMDLERLERSAGIVSDVIIAAPADPSVQTVAIERGQDTTAAVALEQGRKIYTGKCFTCHGNGVAGAPKPGDVADWAPRIARGMQVLTANAINGFQGGRGYMPSRGGFSGLSDNEVTAAVAYMVSESR